MLFNPDRVIPLPSSCTVITYFPSRTYASTSTFPAPHSRSCALSNNSANAPNAQTCDVAFDFNILGKRSSYYYRATTFLNLNAIIWSVCMHRTKMAT
ncbi:unnamed protein product [Bathycoccus prasinos]